MEAISIWVQFAIVAGLIGLAGYHLSIHADQIAEKTGLGRNLAGIIMLGTITSLPELMTGISSVSITDNPNLAIGDVLGSCVFNLLLVFFLDLIYRESSVYSKATQGQLITGGASIIMISYAGFTLAITPQLEIPLLGHVAVSSLLIPLLYVMAMKFMYDFEKKTTTQQELNNDDHGPLTKNVIIFGLSAVVIIACGVSLPFLGEKIMHVMGWESAFVGTIFMAFATSLPEIAVTVSAIRMNAVDLAFSNLLGSNLFNIVMLSIDDLAYKKGALMKAADPSHIVTVFTALMMTGVILLAFIFPPRKRYFRTVNIMSIIILFLFILNSYVIYKT